MATSCTNSSTSPASRWAPEVDPADMASRISLGVLATNALLQWGDKSVVNKVGWTWMDVLQGGGGIKYF